MLLFYLNSKFNFMVNTIHVIIGLEHPIGSIHNSNYLIIFNHSNIRSFNVSAMENIKHDYYLKYIKNFIRVKYCT